MRHVSLWFALASGCGISTSQGTGDGMEERAEEASTADASDSGATTAGDGESSGGASDSTTDATSSTDRAGGSDTLAGTTSTTSTTSSTSVGDSTSSADATSSDAESTASAEETTGGSGEIFRPPYILGADISWTLEQEHAGRTYSDDGQAKSIERILVDHGFNYVRLRTFVCPDCPGGYMFNTYSPAGPDEPWCDTEHTIEMAKRVKACGMGLFLDFHMSDLWASIGEQHVPSAWAGMSPPEMQAAAYDYCKGVLDRMVAEGVKPDMVQVGNEINSRMSGVSINDWAAFSGLIHAGVRAVRDTDPAIVVVAQHGRPRPDGNFRPWVDRLLTSDPPVDTDVICGSTYGTTNDGRDWIDEFGYVIDTYGLPVMSCEYTDNRRDLINPIMRGFANGMGWGTFIWEPTQYGDRTLFDYANGVYRTNANMDEYARIAGESGLPVPSVPAAALDGTTCR